MVLYRKDEREIIPDQLDMAFGHDVIFFYMTHGLTQS